MKRDRVALVLDGDGPPSLVVARSLAAAGWTVVAPAGTRAGRSPACSTRVRVPPAAEDARGFTAAVAGAIADHGVSLVAPAEDSSLELLYETEGLLRGVHVLGGDAAAARLALDKAATLARAQALGFPTPDHVLTADAGEAADAGRVLGFPCVVKPRRSYARRGNRLLKRRHTIAAGPRELERAFARYVGLGFGPPLVQEWVEGRSIGVAAVVRAGRVLAWGAREALTQTPVAGGTAVRRRTVGAGVPGVEAALDLLRALPLDGLGDVQFLVTAGGEPRLMEVGARVYGWLPLTVAAGADLPRVAAEARLGREPAEPVVAAPGVEMRWVEGELLRLAEALDPRATLPPGVRRRDVVRAAWPVWRPGTRYDPSGLGDVLRTLARRT